MKLLVLTHNYPRFKGDSAGVFIQTLTSGVVQRGVQATVLNLWDWRGLQKWGTNLKALTALVFQRFDAVHAHWWAPSGLLAALLKWSRTRLIVTIHRADWELVVKWPFLIPLFGFVCARASVVNFVGGWMEDEHKSMFPAANHQKCKILPMPIGAEFSTKAGGNLRSGAPVVMFVGRLIPYKNLQVFLDATDYAKSCGCVFQPVVVGKGPDSILLENRADVLHLPSLPSHELADWFRKTSILVHPAQREGYGMVIAEAMACGVVPIALRSGGGRDIIKNNETGFLLDSAGQIASCLALLLTDPQGSGFSRVAARLRSERGVLDPQSVVDSFVKLYRGNG